LSSHDNLVNLLDERAAELGKKTYGMFPDGEFTFGELKERSEQLAAGLAERGVGEGDRVCAMMHNRPEFVELFFATMRAGAIFGSVNVSFRGEDLEYHVNDIDPDVLVVDPDCREKLIEVYGEIDVDHTVRLDSSKKLPEAEEMDTYYLDEEPPSPDLTQASPASIIYTSGTTGMPKGVVLPHGAYLNAGVENAERIMGLREEDVVYVSQPLYHIFGQDVIAETLTAGASFGMEKWFSTSNYWDRVEKYGATISHFSPSIAQMVYKETDRPDNPVRLGCGSIDPDLAPDFAEKFDMVVINGYGATETSGFAIANTFEHNEPDDLGTPVRYADVAIVDENDNPVEPGEHGEIVIRPRRPNSMIKRYHGDPERTLEDLDNQLLHMGDIGYVDENGRYHFVERMSHFVRRKDENVSVYEVETAIDELHGVDEVTVVGVDATIGEEILAVIVPDDGVELTPEDIMEHCEQRLAYFKTPRYVRFVDKLPRTETKGSVKRHTLEDEGVARAWDREEADYSLER
jgi:acyl-coenzyme A synthetase/AMP-(fatty) acid ligase